MQREFLGIFSVDFDGIGQLLIIHSAFIKYILEKKWENNEAVHQLFVEFKKAYDSVRRYVLYYILIEFGIPM
jgi:isopentenyldiphosphate isomerase